jgi:hypothetical protein
VCTSSPAVLSASLTSPGCSCVATSGLVRECAANGDIVYDELVPEPNRPVSMPRFRKRGVGHASAAGIYGYVDDCEFNWRRSRADLSLLDIDTLAGELCVLPATILALF